MVGQSANPHHILQTRMKLDRGLYAEEFEAVEIDVDPGVETDDVDELIEEFGVENVQLAYYYMHRHRLFKMHILRVSDLDSNDLVAFLLIAEEQGLRDAEQQAKLKNSSERR